MQTVESSYSAASAVFNTIHPAGEPWVHTVRAGQIFRIVDLEGNQAVDTLFYNAADPTERYSLTHTIQAQGALYLSVIHFPSFSLLNIRPARDRPGAGAFVARSGAFQHSLAWSCARGQRLSPHKMQTLMRREYMFVARSHFPHQQPGSRQAAT